MTEAAITPLFGEAEIAARIEAMAGEISAALPPDLVVVALLKGSFMFAADLMRALHRRKMHPSVDFMTLESYGDHTVSRGTVTMNRSLSDDVRGRDVLLVDDILESGRTLHFARNILQSGGARSVKIAVLLEKPGKCLMPGFGADFVGFSTPDRFVVGYGLDHAGRYRELPFIGAVA